MIDDMYTVMKRINDIRGRFGLKSHWPAQLNNSRKITAAAYPDFQAKALQPRQGLAEQVPVKAPADVKGNTVEEIKKLADYHATANKVPPALVKAVIETESGYNPLAVSPKGAKGLMQLMPAAIRNMGVQDPFDPNENISAGVNLLKNLLQNYNWDYKKALAAYNAGEKAVNIKGGVPDFNETREYVKKVINAYARNSE